jgi:hypothetical protein
LVHLECLHLRVDCSKAVQTQQLSKSLIVCTRQVKALALAGKKDFKKIIIIKTPLPLRALPGLRSEISTERCLQSTCTKTNKKIQKRPYIEKIFFRFLRSRSLVIE